MAVSEEIHETALVGKELKIRGPRNLLPNGPASRYLFIAGGIGITPMLAMVIRAEREKSPYELVYIGRDLDSMAFRDRFATGPHVRAIVTSLSGRPDINELIAQAGDDALIYACGPAGLLTAVEQACAKAGGSINCGSRSSTPMAEPPPRPLVVTRLRWSWLVPAQCSQSARTRVCSRLSSRIVR